MMYSLVYYSYFLVCSIDIDIDIDIDIFRYVNVNSWLDSGCLDIKFRV